MFTTKYENFQDLSGAKTGEVFTFHALPEQSRQRFIWQIRAIKKSLKKRGLLCKLEFSGTDCKATMLRGVDNPLTKAERSEPESKHPLAGQTDLRAMFVNAKAGDVLTLSPRAGQSEAKFIDGLSVARAYYKNKFGILTDSYRIGGETRIEILRDASNPLPKKDRKQDVRILIRAHKSAAPPVIVLNPQDPTKAQQRFARVAARDPRNDTVAAVAHAVAKTNGAAHAELAQIATAPSEEAGTFWREVYMQSLRVLRGSTSEQRVSAANAAAAEFRKRFG